MWLSLPLNFFKEFEDSRGQELCTSRAYLPHALLLSCATLGILFLDNSDVVFSFYMSPPKSGYLRGTKQFGWSRMTKRLSFIERYR